MTFAIQKNHNQVVDLLLSTLCHDNSDSFVDVNAVPENNKTALMIALENRNLDIITKLLQTSDNTHPGKRIDINKKVGNCHQLASIFEHKSDYLRLISDIFNLVFEKKDINGKRIINLTRNNEMSIIGNACKNQNLKIVQLTFSYLKTKRLKSYHSMSLIVLKKL